MDYYNRMSYSFLRENTNFLNISESVSDTNFRILFENNRAEAEKIIDFFASDKSLLVVTGFLGTGKTEIVKNVVKNINSESILLWANCYESTNLDDIFLTFFEKFTHLAANGRVKIPQARFENFSKRINACFTAVDKNIVVVINSYQALMAENMKPVNDFIDYLCEFPNIKVVVISRNFNPSVLNENVKSEKVTFKAFDEGTFQKLLLNNKIKMYGPVADELYKLTKGYYFYTILAVKIMLSSNLSMIDFIREYSNSFMSFKEFLFQETLKFISNPNPHLLRFLTVIRCPVNYKLLSVLQLYDEKFIKTLYDNSIIEIDEGNIYLKDYYKDMSGADIPQNILHKINKACMDLYELQLPRKPEDRDILISRKTIRQEIDYHRMFVPVKYVPKTNSVEIYNSKPIFIKSATTKANSKQDKNIESEDKPKELKDILFVFNEEEEKTVINGIAQSINDFMENVKQQNDEENKMSDEELLNVMNEAEDAFNYKKVINLSKKILLKDDVNNDLKIYVAEKVANCYEKLSDIYNAIKYYETTKNYLADGGNTHKILECEYNIARLNYKIFKHDYAKELLLSLIKVQNPDIKIKSELLLFDIYLDEGDEEKAFETCKEALTILDKNPDKSIVCELMFKCGLIMDIRKNYFKAAEAYERGLKISSSENENKYLIQTYLNLADVYSEVSDFYKAKMYCSKALGTAKDKKDTQNMFTSSLKLAELADNSDEKTKLQLYSDAIRYAENTNDIYCKITAFLSVGDYYFSRHKNMSALENYLEAYKAGKEGFYNDIEYLLHERMLSIKSVINSEVYISKVKEYKYEQL